MKKYVTYLNAVVLLLLVMVAYSTTLHARVEMGLKGGIQVDGFRAGIFAGFKISKYITIQPELHYSQLKHESFVYNYLENNVLYPGSKLEDKVETLEIPLLVKFKFKVHGIIKPFLQIGAYSWFTMSDSEGLVHSEQIPPPYEWLPLQIHHSSVRTDRIYKKSGAGFIFAPGFTLGKGKVKFLMDFRLTYDLTVRQNVDYSTYAHTIEGGEEMLTTYHATFKSKTASLMCGIMF